MNAPLSHLIMFLVVVLFKIYQTWKYALRFVNFLKVSDQQHSNPVSIFCLQLNTILLEIIIAKSHNSFPSFVFWNLWNNWTFSVTFSKLLRSFQIPRSKRKRSTATMSHEKRSDPQPPRIFGLEKLWVLASTFLLRRSEGSSSMQ